MLIIFKLTSIPCLPSRPNSINLRYPPGCSSSPTILSSSVKSISEIPQVVAVHQQFYLVLSSLLQSHALRAHPAHSHIYCKNTAKPKGNEIKKPGHDI